MFAKLINVIFKAITYVANLLMAPIDAIIVSNFPNVASALSSVTQFMTLPFQFMSWILALVHVPTTAITLIISYWIFKYAIVTSIATTKYVITLYQRFKL